MIRKLVCFVLIGLLSISCDSTSSDLEKNYSENFNEIKELKELKEYFNKMVPKGYIVTIRYNSSDDINLFVYQPTNIPDKRELLFQQWNVDYEDYLEPKVQKDKKDYDPRTRSLEVVKKKLKWNNDTFKELYEKLNNANCFGISSGNPTELEYGHRGMGVLSYLIFDKNLNKEEQRENSDNCSTMFYKDNVVFTFSSGATGSFCIPDFKKHK
ncbi:hypothetical protein ACFFLS_09190 [Flavobacterium procerum]|uniref:Lipoprotein n=1 Tax=Flavobacterium procerum TaxID=1455569 RepID=A0ABV6BRE8_9FLAO